MIESGSPSEPEALEETARACAEEHILGQSEVKTLAVYKRLAALPAWIERVKEYCRNPDAAHSRASEWFLDNDYQILRAVRQLETDLPIEFYRRLPGVVDTDGDYSPRIFEIAHVLVDSTRMQLSMNTIVRFINAYQNKADLTIAELWALPAMLRLACLEILADAFHQLNPDLQPPFTVSRYVAKFALDDETERVARGIANLGHIHAINWAEVVDRTSVVEQIMLTDPANVYPQMTFESRDRYRQVIEALSRTSGQSESDVARLAISKAQENPDDERQSHVGFWLSGKGKEVLEGLLGCRLSLTEKFKRGCHRHASGLFALALTVVTLFALLVPAFYVERAGTSNWATGGVLLLTLPLALVLSISIVYWMITVLVPPKVLPALDFRKGIPSRYSTAVIVPVIISDHSEVSGLLERLEIRRLSNPDPHLRFVLLSDLADFPTQYAVDDDVITAALVAGIKRLNAPFDDSSKSPYFLLHRQRQYNATERCWMGWERKRGKIEQFNRFLSEGLLADFVLTEGPVELLRRSRFVITLDADTTLPGETAAQLVGTMAHPLNQACFDPRTGRVISGYTVLQPRIEALPVSRSDSHFSRLYAGDSAIDIYSRAVSDVYQDLFGSGIYVGKGLYDVQSFERSLVDKVPENRLLSHDLFEGIQGRTALVTNIVLYESFPINYRDYAMRLHRWIRGDWQLIPWLKRRVPMRSAARASNPLSALDRWKIIDNLRRSLVAPMMMLFLLGGWLFFPGNAWIWTALALAAPLAWLVGESILNVVQGVRYGRLGDTLHNLREKGGRWLLSIVFLSNDTLISIDAIARTLWRLKISKTLLLQWQTAAHTENSSFFHSHRNNLWSFMWPSVVLAALFAIIIVLYEPSALLPAAPVLLLWLLAPEVAWLIDKPRVVRRETLSDHHQAFLTQTARRTWHYFETFTGPEDNWLPPDNVQEVPTTLIAHRTSPTNIGLYLVSASNAHDFGFIGTEDFVLRATHTLDSLDNMEHYRGHLLNWFDTRNLEPLEPRYVSTVDSGNLAFSLLVLKQCCLEIGSGQLLARKRWQGFECTLDLLFGALEKLPTSKDSSFVDIDTAIRQAVASVDTNVVQWKNVLQKITLALWPELERRIGEAMDDTTAVDAKTIAEIHLWLERVGHHLYALQRELNAMAPWLALIDEAPTECLHTTRAVGNLLSQFSNVQLLPTLQGDCNELIDTAISNHGGASPSKQWLESLKLSIGQGVEKQLALVTELDAIASRAEAMAYRMDFTLTYREDTRLFRIGFNVSTSRLDDNHYDFLATEARLASFFAIAKKDAPLEHWFHLGRPIARLQHKPSILSWNGSMFEYLMPPLFLPSRRETLLGESEATAVEYQKDYAKSRQVPWGISESSFGATDSDGIYQYRAFGAPGLGIRRGLSEDLVIAPYASALALCVWPRSAVENLERLRDLGAVGTYGYIEALDFTPERKSASGDFLPIRSYMAHHHGMTIAAISNALLDDINVRRVFSDKRMRSVELLLQERIPWDAPTEKGRIDEPWPQHKEPTEIPALHPWIPSAAIKIPQLHRLGNGRFSTCITEAGSGGLSWNKQSLTRWIPDPTRDADGYWIYIRDTDNGNVWSLGRQPVGTTNQEASVVFHQHMVEMHRRDDDLAIRLEVTVPPGHDVDIRRVTVSNERNVERIIELISYAEVVLAPPLDDERHPAFSKLFVGHEFIEQERGLLFTRRPRSPEKTPPVLLHKLVADHEALVLVGVETDRACFIGRNRSEQDPASLRAFTTADQTCESTTQQDVSWSLDPVMSLRVRLRLKPLESVQFAFVTIAADSRQRALEVGRQFDMPSLELEFANALRDAAHTVNRFDLSPDVLPMLQTLASLLYFPHAALRESPTAFSQRGHSQPDLWRFGISGDLPILLLRVHSEVPSDLFELLIRAQRLWHHSGLSMDLVVLRSGTAGYEEPLRERLMSVLRDAGAYGSLGRSGGVHLLSADHIGPSSRRGLAAIAHVVMDDDDVSLAGKLDAMLAQRSSAAPFHKPRMKLLDTTAPLPERGDLLFDNELGGFDSTAQEYVMRIDSEHGTPAPWCNILANSQFGTMVSESGLGFSWGVNSGEHKITAFANDPVLDTPGEALYLRDEETAEVWSTTPAPIIDDVPCEVRHGMGYSVWSRNSHGLEQELLSFVPTDDPIKIVRLRLHNSSPLVRRITATYYADWLLGALSTLSKPQVVCKYVANEQTIYANNAWNQDFAERVAFLTSVSVPHSISCDRQEFLGQEGSLAAPAALRRWDLGGHVNAGVDSCGAYQVHLDVDAGSDAEVVFILGEGDNQTHAAQLVRRWQSSSHVNTELDQLTQKWDSQLQKVQVSTPDVAFDVMTNHWLPYQIHSSRLLARAGPYQVSGAYGFRDQLQDVLALLWTQPKRVRAHILEAARHQFEEGDVLHWWHPPSDRGVKTKITDDYLWLIYVTARYIDVTGDYSILTVNVPFLRANPLQPDEHDRYAQFEVGDTASLYEHCVRALNRMLTTGEHGLPLIGTGDWNDGMDRVGIGGKGESLWLAWFQIAVINQFTSVLEGTKHQNETQRWQEHAVHLKQAIDDAGWDGDWFVRAFDDDGKSWGSKKNTDCKIDSIAQSWGVFAGYADEPRIKQAMYSAAEYLVLEQQRLVLLQHPPFNRTDRDPGYIKAYPPGIRENGGQYTHAAAWLGIAFAGLRDGEMAWKIFDIINPVRRTLTRTDAEHYAREPYVVSADVYGPGAHVGKGGWSWYTGAASWTWQLAVEWILGVRIIKGAVSIDPCLPPNWGHAEVVLKRDVGSLRIVIEDPEHVGHGVQYIMVDGQELQSPVIEFPTEDIERVVVVRLAQLETDVVAKGHTHGIRR